MVHSTSRPAGIEARAVRNQFDEQSGLPFLDVLSVSEVESACRLGTTVGGTESTLRGSPWACSCRRSSPPIALAATP